MRTPSSNRSGNGTHNFYEKREYTFNVLLEYSIIMLLEAATTMSIYQLF